MEYDADLRSLFYHHTVEQFKAAMVEYCQKAAAAHTQAIETALLSHHGHAVYLMRYEIT